MLSSSVAASHTTECWGLSQVHADAGSAGRNRLFVIPAQITDNTAVLECLQFYFMTSILVDIQMLTKKGTVPIEEALSYEAVKRPEFSFDLLVTKTKAPRLLPLLLFYRHSPDGCLPHAGPLPSSHVPAHV